MIPSLLLIALATFYAAFMLRQAAGLRRVLRQPLPPEPAAWPRVSVVIPARNEATAITACVRAVLRNTYPPDRLDVLVVDDASTDATPALVQRLIRQHAPLVPANGDGTDDARATGPALRLLRLEGAAWAHKKRALEHGIAHATGDIILTTDADCHVPPDWVRTMVRHFTRTGDDQPEVAFVSGPVLYRTDAATGGSTFARAQALEFLGLVALGAGAIGAGRPTLCNGANVAYRRHVFEALGGYQGLDHLTSGDDELLMQRIADETPYEVRFCAAPEAAVTTVPAPTLRRLIEQRRRWASKGPRYPRRGLVALLSGIYGFYVMLLGSLVALPFAPALGPAVAVALGLKLGAEAFVLGPACRHFGRRDLLRLFVPTQLVQIPYVVLIAPLGALGGYEWKGRRVRQ